MNPEADENTKDFQIQDAIGSTLFSQKWLLQALDHEIFANEEDLESISEMSCNEEVAQFLNQYKMHFKLMSQLFKNVSPRIQELVLVILSNMLRINYEVFKEDQVCLQIPLTILSSFSEFQVPVLISLFQYLTIFTDLVIENGETEQLFFDAVIFNNTLIVMASTLDQDLLGKATRFLFSLLELVSEENESLIKDQIANPQSCGLLCEALKQSIANNDEKTSFILIEILAAIFDFLEENVLKDENAYELCENLSSYLQTFEEDIDDTSVKSCAKICSVLWTTICHLKSFQQISQCYLNKMKNNILSGVVKKCLEDFLACHSSTLMTPENLSSPVLQEIVNQLLMTPK